VAATSQHPRDPSRDRGGFGGKTIIYLEPVAYMLSKKSAGRSDRDEREEVFRPPANLGAVVEVKIGAKKDGRITAAKTCSNTRPVRSRLAGPAGLHLRTCGLRSAERRDNRLRCSLQSPQVAAYRAPGAPIGSFAIESCVDELARELGIDPLRMREMNGAKDGTKATHGPTGTTSAI